MGPVGQTVFWCGTDISVNVVEQSGDGPPMFIAAEAGMAACRKRWKRQRRAVKFNGDRRCEWIANGC